jgi:hypothetical protein
MAGWRGADLAHCWRGDRCRSGKAVGREAVGTEAVGTEAVDIAHSTYRRVIYRRFIYRRFTYRLPSRRRMPPATPSASQCASSSL